MSEGSERLAEEMKLETLTGPARALAVEAVRVKARLDELEDWITGDSESWMRISERFGNEVELVFSAPMVEARQQALALVRIFGELTKMLGADKVPAAPPISKADDLAQRRKERLQGSA